MPTVPKYQGGQVNARGINARQNIRVTSDAFGGNIAKAQIGLGREISKQGDMLFNHQMEIRDEYDKGVMREMDNNYSSYIREKWTDFSQLKGRAALDAKQAHEDEIKAYRVKLAKDLDPRLMNSWNAMADARTNNVLNKTAAFTSQQTIVYNEAQTLARIASQTHEAGACFDNIKCIRSAMQVGLNDVKDLMQSKYGIDANNAKNEGEKAIIAQARLAFTSDAHTQVIENLEIDFPSKALDYYKANKAEIDSSTYNTLESRLEDGTLRKRAQRTTDEILTNAELVGDNKAQLEAARKIEDPKLRDEVVSRILNRQSQNKSNRLASEDGAYDQVQKHIVKGGSKDGLPPGVWDAMSGSQQRTIQAVLDTRVANSLKPKNPVQAKTNFYALEDLAHNNYEEFKKLNLGLYIGLVDEVDLDNLRKLQKSHTAVKSSLTRKEQLKMTLGSMNMYFSNFEKNGDSGDRVRAFIATVDAKVARFVENKNREPDDQEYQKILLDVSANEAYVNGYGSDSKMSIGAMTEDQKSKAYVTVDGEDIFLSEIPDLKRAQIIEQIKQRKGKVTAQNIAEVYVAQSKIEKQANLKKAKNIQSSIISMEQAETLADEAENKFGAVDIGLGDGDIEDIDKLNALSAEHLEALILTEDWSDDNLIILEDLLEKKLKQRIDKGSDENSLENEEDSVDDDLDTDMFQADFDRENLDDEYRGTLTRRGYRKKVEPREGKDMTDYELTKRGYRKKSKPKKDKDKSNDENSSENKNKSGLTRRGYRKKVEPKKKIKKVKTRRGYR